MRPRGMTKAAVSRIKKLSMPEPVKGDVHKEIEMLVSGEPEDVEKGDAHFITRDYLEGKHEDKPERTTEVPLPRSPVNDEWKVEARSEADMAREVVRQELGK